MVEKEICLVVYCLIFIWLDIILFMYWEERFYILKGWIKIIDYVVVLKWFFRWVILYNILYVCGLFRWLYIGCFCLVISELIYLFIIFILEIWGVLIFLLNLNCFEYLVYRWKFLCFSYKLGVVVILLNLS